ncbi:UPF0149 family protein [Ferrimonas balearica]|uniref:UPF0149 family protein n=1 Tax=Ferrimonas balearica TaxID=44012 RepID=UPI001C942508|nr:UPF0149 family protein [Ferrimonas balearica]MBY5981407.1 UPF0149 family protein [Ferrimonas balearica]MBY6018800.1 UPF0149 family protein [Halomonas denitrificans]MBY6095990.1 UPF0149 family protein [Ferrimonas balearica]
MKCNSPLLLSKLQTALDDAKIAVLPAEVHGVLTGLVCGGVPMDGQSWQKPFLELVNDGEPAPEPVMTIVKELYLDVINTLVDPSMSFSPLLADDDDPLQDRLEAFINWVQSFLTGLAMMQPALDKASADVKELIQDLTDFTQVELEVEENEENEEGFAALVEHVRIAAWECLREFRGLDDDEEAAPKTLH